MKELGFRVSGFRPGLCSKLWGLGRGFLGGLRVKGLSFGVNSPQSFD